MEFGISWQVVVHNAHCTILHNAQYCTMHNIAQCTMHNAHRSMSQQGGCQRGDLDGGGPGSQLSAPPPPWLYIRVLSANVHFSVNPIVLVDALDTTSSMSSTSNLPTSPDLTATSTSGITSFSTLTGLQWLAPLPSYYGLCPFFLFSLPAAFWGQNYKNQHLEENLNGEKNQEWARFWEPAESSRANFFIDVVFEIRPNDILWLKYLIHELPPNKNTISVQQ